MRQHQRTGTGLAALALLAGCVTINVYFPAVAAERAADRIIEDVWGPQARDGEESGSNDESGDEGERGALEPALRLAVGLLDLVVPPARAADEPDIDISSPAIREIVASMEKRHAALRPYYESGAIGLDRDATIEIRDLGAVPLPERTRLRKLVSEENADRNALYREIAVANGHPEWEDRIRATFAERWIDKARSGWYYRGGNGDWVRK